MKTARIKEALVLAFAPPPIFGLGTAGGFEFYIQNHGEGGPQRTRGGAAILGRASKEPQLAFVNTFWRANVPQLQVDLDRDQGQGARRADRRPLWNARGHRRHLLRQRLQQVRRTWQVLMSAEPATASAQTPSATSTCGRRRARWCRSTLANVAYSSGPDSLDRFNNLPR